MSDNKIEASYPLSPMQKSMTLSYLLAPESGVYLLQMVCTFREALNVLAFKKAWQQILSRHHILRSGFRWQGLEEPLQDVYFQVEVPFEVHDWQHLDAEEQKNRFQEFLKTDRHNTFNLAEAPVMRLNLFQLGAAEYKLIWTYHHNILDGACHQVFLDELFQYYEANCEGRDISLPLVRPYQEYIDWLRQQDSAKSESYWRETLAGFKSPTPIGAAPSIEYFVNTKRDFDEIEIVIPEKVTKALQALATENKVSLHNVTQAAWALLLSRYSRGGDIVFGTVRAGRHWGTGNTNEMMGLFIYTLPIRISVSPEKSLISWLQEIKQSQFSVRDHEATPLADIQKWSEVPQNRPLFESIVSFQNFYLTTAMQSRGGKWLKREFYWIVDNGYPITLYGNVSSELRLKLDFDRNRFDNAATSWILDNLKNILEAMAENPHRSLGEFTVTEPAAPATARESIPQVENLPVGPERAYVPPDNKLQQSIAAIWQEVLGVNMVGMNDNFFELGGTSMQIVRVYQRIREIISGEFNVTDVFRFPTINTLTAFLSQRESNNGQDLARQSTERAMARRANIMQRQQLRRGARPEASPSLPGTADTPKNTERPAATIAVAATFTAEPVTEALKFWGEKLQHPFKIEFSPYDQVFQQLLGSSTLFSNNTRGMNVVLVRFEDWVRNDKTSTPDEKATKIRENTSAFITALKSASGQSTAPFLVCLCPASPSASGAMQPGFFRELEGLVLAGLADAGNIYLVRSSEMTEAYGVTRYYDAFSDELGHIPYTPEFFTALGTIIARKFHNIYSAPYKVIVLDCDQTLWKGICGEDGPLGIEIDEPHKMLQEFMVKQYQAGMLICLCSKNNPDDVSEVFRQHPEMPLKQEHITSSVINWRSKAENLQALAVKLELGLDSFIFIDDNPVECNEVQTFCPEVLTLCLPERPENIPAFLQHVWAFDHLKITDEDKKRTVLYQQNAQRKSFQEQSANLADFIAGLGLKVSISPAQPNDIPRVAQLTRRTNQFNLTTIRRSEAEIQELYQTKTLECLTTEVSDRFGDYGLVGIVLFNNEPDAIKVDTFLLSCRVMGKGIEHRMLARLGEIAVERGLAALEVSCVPTPKNQPARDFLEGIASEYRQPLESGFICRFPAGYAASITYVPGLEKTPHPDETAGTKSTPPSNHEKQAPNLAVSSGLFRDIAVNLNNAAQILNIIESQSQKERPELPGQYLPPDNEIERAITAIWQKVLGIDRVGIHDNFFEIGGTSVKGVQLIAQLNRDLKVNVPIVTLFERPTISTMAALLAGESGSKITK